MLSSSDMQRGIVCLNMKVVGDICLLRVGHVTTCCSGECCFGVMYVEWYGVCGFVVLSVVEICVDYGCVSCLFSALFMVLAFIQGPHRNLLMNFYDFSMTICHFSMTFDHQPNSFATTPF